MKKLKEINFKFNNQLITTGYGRESDGDEDYGSRHLKFARFNIFSHGDNGLQFKSEYAQTCKGRS